MDAEALIETAVRSEDVKDLLNHIAWVETIKPALLDTKTAMAELLVNHTLGEPLPKGLTQEQLAGRIQGITFIVKLMEKILKEGATAIAELRTHGFTLS